MTFFIDMCGSSASTAIFGELYVGELGGAG
jgi:hypothetical protein